MKYYNPTTQQVEEWGTNPEQLNPEGIAGKTSVPETTPLGGGYTPITPGDLEPVSGLPYVNPNQAMFSMPSTPTLPSSEPLAPTPKEKSISDLIAELTASSGLAGEKAGYQVEQEKVAGLETMRASEADYTAQLTQLNAEYKNVENRMQLAAEGRGITAGGLAPFIMAEQRKLSIQANTVSALLAATQGKITYAQAQVDRAVNAKYAQAEADRKAKLENLQLLSQDPTLTLEQKNRAALQTKKLKDEEKADTKKKEDSKTIMDWAVKAVQNGATPEQAKAISDIAMFDNPDLTKAFQLYSPFAKEKLTGQSDFEQAFLRDKGRLPTVEEILDYKRREAAAGRAPIGAGVAEVTPEIIADYARRLDAKEITLSNIPDKIRNQVLEQSVKAKQPRDFTDDEIRTLINEDKTAGSSYEDIISAIDAFPTLKNKDRAKLIADEIFEKKKETTGGLFGAVSSFFSRLFGK